MLKNCYIGIEGYLTVKLVCVNSNPWLLCCYTGSTSPKSTGHTFGGHCDNVVNAPIWGQRLIWRWGGHTFWKCHWRGSMMLCLVQRFCLYHGLGAYSKSDYLVGRKVHCSLQNYHGLGDYNLESWSLRKTTDINFSYNRVFSFVVFE